MQVKIISLLLFVLCPLTDSLVCGQDLSAALTSDKKPAKAVVSPTPATPTVGSFRDQPEIKSYSTAMQEKDLTKKVAALEKFAADFPNSIYLTSVHTQLLNSLVKTAPADKERIYRLALETVASVKTEYPQGSADSISSTYNEVVEALVSAKMDDKAAEIAQKGIALIDEVNAQTIFRTKHFAWLQLGQIYLRKNDLKKAESYFKQSISGDYEGNAALLGLAEIAGKNRNDKLQLGYLIQADAKGRLNKEHRASLENLYLKQHGSTTGLRGLLDENYKRENPLPFNVVKYSPTAMRTKRTVLAELFAGTECRPCVTADTTFEALLVRYDPAEVVVLTYDLHVPGPDPLTNPTSLARAKFYGVNNAPVPVINGVPQGGGGGSNRKLSKIAYDMITPKIDAQLEKESEADLKLSASVGSHVVTTAAVFDNVKGEYSDLRLYIGLVENELSYTGGNGVRFHPMVVREMAGEEHNGFALKDKRGRIEWQFDLWQVSAGLKNYIDKYEQGQQIEDKDFAFAEKKYRINDKNLSVVAFIQDEKTKNVLQSAFINLSETK